MPRAIPILVIVGLAIYSFFDVLNSRNEDLRKFSRTTWLMLVLVPVVGAALWFLVGRPRGRARQGPPRIITIRGQQRPSAPDDDPAFLRRLEEEAWRRKRDEARRRAAEEQSGGPTKQPPPKQDGGDGDKPPKGQAPGGPGIAPA